MDFIKKYSTDCLFLLLIFSALFYIFFTYSSSELYFNGPDEAHHAFNGVFYMDFFKQGGFLNPIDYTLRYYAHNPAISIHIFQPFFPIYEALIFAIFGVSTFSAKLSIFILTIFLLIGFYTLIASKIDRQTAFFSTLLLFSNPTFLKFVPHVMLEIPGLLFICVIPFLILSNTKKYRIIGYFLSLAAPILINHKIVFFYPVIFSYFIFSIKPDIKTFVLNFISLVLFSYFLMFLIRYLPVSEAIRNTYHLGIFDHLDLQWLLSGGNITLYLKYLVNQLGWLSILLFVVSIFVLISKNILVKENIIVYFLLIFLWNLLLCSLFLPLPVPRMLFYLLPAAAVINGLLLTHIFRKGKFFSIFTSALAIYFIYIAFSNNIYSANMTGYRKSAEYIELINKNQAPVLFDGAIPTSFVFERVATGAQQAKITYRSDKIFIDSMKHQWVSSIQSKKDIIQAMKKFGIKYVVIDSIPYKSFPNERFRELIKDPELFRKAAIFPVRFTTKYDKNRHITIYEYLSFQTRQIEQIKIQVLDKEINFPL